MGDINIVPISFLSSRQREKVLEEQMRSCAESGGSRPWEVEVALIASRSRLCYVSRYMTVSIPPYTSVRHFTVIHSLHLCRREEEQAPKGESMCGDHVYVRSRVLIGTWEWCKVWWYRFSPKLRRVTHGSVWRTLIF